MFTWTEEKNQLNRKKHGFFFSEITDVFDDPYLIEFFDEAHSTTDEERYICLGRWQDFFILSVVFTEKGDNIHLITARKATTKERKIYEENYKKETSRN
ncbi:MAG: BrnT family toxin [Treponema sp.]|jgi:uncharacterized DUF497 family protein|nr:BrnT family toxin [Treponema sp.]